VSYQKYKSIGNKFGDAHFYKIWWEVI